VACEVGVGRNRGEENNRSRAHETGGGALTGRKAAFNRGLSKQWSDVRLGFPNTEAPFIRMTLSETYPTSPPSLHLSFPLYNNNNNHGWYSPSRLGRRFQVVHACTQSSRPSQCAFQQPITRLPAQMDWRHERETASPSWRRRRQGHCCRTQDPPGRRYRLHWRSHLLNGKEYLTH
jgi:hypothetical protein